MAARVSPIPLQIHGSSGLQFPWAFEAKEDGSSMNASFGGDGVAWSEVLWIEWGDLQECLQALVGYSYREIGLPWGLTVSYIPGNVVNVAGQPYICIADSLGNEPPNAAYWAWGSVLRRKLPWQHPYMNQLWVKNIADVHGWRMVGTNQDDEDDDFSTTVAGSPGNLYALNQGPWTEYERAKINVQFWRPPYYVRTDDAVTDDFGFQQEWLRYTQKRYEDNQQILNREASQLQWAGGGTQPGLPGGVGQVVTHTKLTCTWYEIPEACIFQYAQDATPNGQATNLTYTQTTGINPITGYELLGGSVNPIASCVNLPVGGAADNSVTIVLSTVTTVQGSAEVTVTGTTAGITGQGTLLADGTSYDGDAVSGDGIATGSTVLSVPDSTHLILSLPAELSGTGQIIVVTDADIGLRFFGQRMGTLRFDYKELRERPLQLPPYLMQIPAFADNEALSQVQYDVILHFDVFDPQRPPNGAGVLKSGSARGHNLMPYAATGLWYPVHFNVDTDNSTVGPFPTPHMYADLSDLFVPR